MTEATYWIRLEHRAMAISGTLHVSHVGTKQVADALRQHIEKLATLGYRIVEIDSPVPTGDTQ